MGAASDSVSDAVIAQELARNGKLGRDEVTSKGEL